MNIVISDPKEGKAYSKKTEQAVFVGRKINEVVSLDVIGLKGYKAVITGGSDKDGFPMKPSLEGQGRKKLLIEKGIGIKKKRKGEKRRKRVRANTVAPDIHQLNLKITEYGSTKLSEYFKKTGGEEKLAEEKKGGAKKGETEKEVEEGTVERKQEEKKPAKKEGETEKKHKPKEKKGESALAGKEKKEEHIKEKTEGKKEETAGSKEEK